MCSPTGAGKDLFIVGLGVDSGRDPLGQPCDGEESFAFRNG
jgi:hypothetical protein